MLNLIFPKLENFANIFGKFQEMFFFSFLFFSKEKPELHILTRIHTLFNVTVCYGYANIDDIYKIHFYTNRIMTIMMMKRMNDNDYDDDDDDDDDDDEDSDNDDGDGHNVDDDDDNDDMK
uniref:Uncharacterized protein n=1 Tax=Octopus bimaculoides TaxID=37653 RepID=A0A0L8HS57_OCTBM